MNEEKCTHADGNRCERVHFATSKDDQSTITTRINGTRIEICIKRYTMVDQRCASMKERGRFVCVVRAPGAPAPNVLAVPTSAAASQVPTHHSTHCNSSTHFSGGHFIWT